MNPLADRIIDLYDRHAVQWDEDRARVPWLEKPWFDRFVGLLPDRASVLDLGCGSGSPVARFLAQHDLRVTGVDGAPAPIALCRSRLPHHEWIVADMRAMSLGRRFAGVLAWDSFFHLPHEDQRQMFAVFGEHAAAGAILMFNTGDAHTEAIGDYRGEPLYHASLGAAEYRRLLDLSGFDVVAHEVKDAGAGGRTVWLARSRPR